VKINDWFGDFSTNQIMQNSKPEKLTKEEKQAKYGKKYKKNYMKVAKIHLGNDQEYKKMEHEQKHFKKMEELDSLFQTKKGTKLSSEELRLESLFDKKRKERDTLGYVRIVTPFGNINCELYVSKAPRTCYNFYKLCESNLYTNTTFHRLIPGFMVQGGKVSTGSVFGKQFVDEIDADLKHDDFGILSMANAGPNTNESEFFITFGPTPHLDGLHTIFGKVVGGLAVVSEIEKQPVNEYNKPLKQIKIEQTILYGNPFENVDK
jgi:cyclophilin family peptidyl-prolyl cis-trans isomerase